MNESDIDYLKRCYPTCPSATGARHYWVHKAYTDAFVCAYCDEEHTGHEIVTNRLLDSL